MEFSRVVKSNGTCSFSPDGQYLAHISKNHLYILDVEELEVLLSKKLLDRSTFLKWGSDSAHVLVAFRKKAIVLVFNITNSSYQTKITEGVAGLTYARFSPDCQFVLTSSDFTLRISVWPLIGNSAQPVGNITFPKFATKGLDFSKNGKYMALAERKNCEDYISVFVTDTWELVKQYKAQTDDLVDLRWSPNGAVLCVWDNCVKYRVNFFSIDGKLLKSYKAYDNALGVRNVSWEPGSSVVGIGSYDEKIRLINRHTWKELAELEHKKKIEIGRVTVFTEVQYSGTSTKLSPDTQIGSENRTRYISSEPPVSLRQKKTSYNKPNPKRGVSAVKWSHDGKYIASKSDSFPNVIWIWETGRLALITVILQLSPVQDFKWDPKHPRLALCTGNGRIYFFNGGQGFLNGCSCVDLPTPNFRVNRLKWNVDGKSMVLVDNVDKNLSLCYPGEQEDDEDDETGDVVMEDKDDSKMEEKDDDKMDDDE